MILVFLSLLAFFIIFTPPSVIPPSVIPPNVIPPTLTPPPWTGMSGGRTSNISRRVFDFWFGGELPLNRPVDPNLFKLWFGADPSVDRSIHERFQHDLEDIYSQRDGPYDDILSDPNRALASTIILDQFSRNMFRDTPRMFSQDELALKVSRLAIKKGYDEQIPHPIMRLFFYMPFMHAEDIVAQEEGIVLFQKICSKESSESPFKDALENNAAYMKKHRDIIAKFGRFPHRNAFLGRDNTDEEALYLSSGGETFDARRSGAK